MFVLDGRPIEEGLYPAAGDTGSYFFIPVFLTTVYITYKRLIMPVCDIGSYFFIPVFLTSVYITYKRPIMPVCDIGKININNTRYLKSKQVK